MKIKSSLFILMVFPFPLALYGQLNSTHNGLRAGDSLIKRQVEYKNPGQSGANRTWDFSELTTVNKEYVLYYSLPPSDETGVYITGKVRFDQNAAAGCEFITGTEHNTVYYYRAKNDTLTLLGHENPVVRLEYGSPLLILLFPVNYGESASAIYSSEALYSSSIPLRSEGHITVEADAYGRMFLPEGLRLDTVLRIKTTQVIDEFPGEYSTNESSVRTRTETCRWYTKGYRYPVFETVRGVNEDESEIFATAFYFPPQEHLYIDNDPENRALLDKLWNIGDFSFGDETAQAKTKPYKVWPNPVAWTLYVELTLENPSDVDISLYSVDGKLHERIRRRNLTGVHRESIDCTKLPVGLHVLRLNYGGKTVNETIIKE
jgi:hypothetical protein